MWEVINLFQLQNKFLATQLMVGYIALCVKKMCLRWEKGKLQIKEEISLLRIASLWDSSTNDVFWIRFYVQHFRPDRSKSDDESPEFRYLYPSENQTPVEWKVLFSSVWLTCVLFAENGHISSDSFFFHWHSHFFHLSIFCWKQQQ